jgi:hypothetical protein
MKMGIENATGSNPNYVDLVKLIRSIQRAEGNIDCYRRGLRQCGRMDCAWREHCLIVSGGKSTRHFGSQTKKEAAGPKQD